MREEFASHFNTLHLRQVIIHIIFTNKHIHKIVYLPECYTRMVDQQWKRT